MYRAAAALAAVVLVAGCGFRPSAHVDFATIDAGPAWSPDGRLIAFASSRSGGGIYVVRPDGTGLRRLVAGAASDPAWSPDGRWLAYSTVGGIELVRDDGLGRHRLVRGRLGLPAWRPDGRRLALVRGNADAVPVVESVGRDGTGLRRLVPPHLPRSSPAWNLVDAGESEPAWSPDGRKLVLEAGNEAVLVYDLAARDFRRVSDDHGAEPAWSPDGKLIAFETAGRLAVVNADGTGLQTFEADEPRAHAVEASGFHPAWSPDSRRVVFEVTHDRGRYTRRAVSLSVVDLATGDVRELIYDGSSSDDPTWRDGVVGKTSW